MKVKSFFCLSLVSLAGALSPFLLFPIPIFSENENTGIASRYPGDVNIQTDPDVLFTEKFNDGMAAVLSRYDNVLNAPAMTLDNDVPEGSEDSRSIKLSSVSGSTTGGHLFKRFEPGFDSVIYIRYYVKYPSSSKGYFHHEALWLGGYNPAVDWPYPRAGNCGLAGERISICYEPVWQDTNPPGMDTYLYWGDMRSWNGGSSCYGNAMITRGATDSHKPASNSYPAVDFDKWMCVELMVKLNDPVSVQNGELAVWVNGKKMGHWGPGFPNGHWDKDKWYNNPDDPPFPGYRWRTNTSLNINWIWLEYFHDNAGAPSSYIKFSNVVIAKKYIGPISAKHEVAPGENK